MSRGETTVWWWLRHAPVRDGDRLVYGHTDLEIGPTSEAEYRRVAEALPVDAVWMTSHLKRARQTAAKLSRYHPGAEDAVEEPAFAEMHFGEWEGVGRDKIPADEEAQFWENFVDEGPPKGESFGAVINRVTTAMAQHTVTYSGRHIVAVGHSGSIRAALTLGAAVTPEATLAFVLEPLRVTRVNHSQGKSDAVWSIGMVNGLSA